MGCGGSKLDDLEAVALCRSRVELLAEAIRHRYALADAHAAYCNSLRSVGVALHRVLDDVNGAVDNSPVLPLPGQRKGDSLPPPSPLPAPAPPPPAAAIPTAHSHSRSHSGSHIHFHSDDSDSDGESPFHSDGDSPIHLHADHNETVTEPSYVNLHYARSNPPPSVSFEQRVGSSEQAQYGPVSGPSSSSYPYGYPYPIQNSSSYPYPFSEAYHPNHQLYGGIGGFFGSSSPPPAISHSIPSGARANSGASTSRAAPPPPSPPRTSTWDFLNPFEAFESFYPPYTSSRSSKEVREDEGIPDLEEDEQEVIKQAYGDKKFIASTSAAAPEQSSKGVSAAKEDVDSPTEGSNYPAKAEVEEDVVEKNVVRDEVQKPQEVRRNFVATRRYANVSEVASEIRVQFERAAETAKELSRMLEVGKHRYSRKGSVFAVSSRIMCAIPVAMSKDVDLAYEEDKVMSTGNLSSTLQKLMIWEQKLLDEVRVEESMRMRHDRKSKKLQRMDEKGAESHKIDATQKLIRKLSTQIMIAIQVVNSISTKINVLRDEELWPQIDEFIQGLERMWKGMLECHQIQCQAISEANFLDSIASGGQLSDSHVNAIMQLELELLGWMGNFASWIYLQKSFVKSLNGWLVLCLHYEPEVTADGVPPYSPGRIGAPPAFVIFNCWFQSLDRVSEKDVLHAMKSFASRVKQIWQQNDIELRQKMIVNREVERLQKKREREAQVINKELEALNRKLDITSLQDSLLPSQPAEPGSLRSSLKQVLEALESFTTNSLKAYEDVRARAEEEKAAIGAQI
ncbi:hypothetical protein KSP39_PZI022761 [Platanthera zijinensis]|uniref:BZIP transcription factor n=1 Tax=Platanthera zijinensis TaxID=2320716 RepID=A0AAP0AV42_9ASPA